MATMCYFTTKIYKSMVAGIKDKNIDKALSVSVTHSSMIVHLWIWTGYLVVFIT